jgi:hypothetical protein
MKYSNLRASKTNNTLFLGGLLLILTFTFASYTQNLKPLKVIDTGFCELLRSPEDFDQKKIRLRALYRYGFEWSEIYCLDCSEKGDVWLEIGADFERLTKRNLRKKVNWSEKGRTVDVIAIGTFYSHGGYGHLGGYRYKLVVDYFESADVILKDSPVVLPDKLKHRANCSLSNTKTQ